MLAWYPPTSDAAPEEETTVLRGRDWEYSGFAGMLVLVPKELAAGVEEGKVPVMVM